MRISAARRRWVSWVILCVACGGAQRDRGPRVASCADYVVAVRAPLARLARAADEARLEGTPDEGARGARELAARVAAERDALAGLRIDAPELARAHRPLVGALGDMTAALELLGDVLARRDEGRRGEARAQLGRATDRWAAAVDALRAVCPVD